MTFKTAITIDEPTIPRGTSKFIRVQVVDHEDNPYDITAYDLKLRVAHTWSGKAGRTPYIEKDAIEVNPTEGKILFTFRPKDTREWAVGSYDFYIFAVHKATKETFEVCNRKLAVSQSIADMEVEEE